MRGHLISHGSCNCCLSSCYVPVRQGIIVPTSMRYPKFHLLPSLFLSVFHCDTHRQSLIPSVSARVNSSYVVVLNQISIVLNVELCCLCPEVWHMVHGILADADSGMVKRSRADSRLPYCGVPINETPADLLSNSLPRLLERTDGHQ